MRVLDLFSGIGGFSLGLERTGGFSTVAFCERDEYCQRVLAKHWPGVPIHDDIRTMPRVSADVFTGGFPCQPFSSAAHGRNNAPDLWPEFARLVERDSPRWVIAENVPGLGLAGIDRVCGDLEVLGYTAWPADVDTSPPGRSRGRRRFFVLAHANREGKPLRAVDAQVASVPSLPGPRPDDPCPLGVDDGLSHRTHRLRALGNAVVPQVVALLGEAILASEAA